MKTETMERGFLGYGDPKEAKYWFVGPEEAGSAEQVIFREEVWTELGCKPLLDVQDFHLLLARKPGCGTMSRLFSGDQSLIQRTWRDLIRLTLSFENSGNVDDDTESIGNFQARRLSKEAMLLECRGGQDTFIRPDRVLEEATCERGQLIRDLIKENKPALVVFYGVIACDQAGMFGEMAIGRLDVTTDQGRAFTFRYGATDDTVIGLAPHPNARGLQASHWRSFGRVLRGVRPRAF